MKSAGTALISCALLQVALAAGPSPSDRFYEAIRADQKRAVQELLESGVDVNTPDYRGNTPLMHAAAVGSAAMMRLLIAAGAGVNAKNSFEATALIWCANQPEKARLLVEKGADVNARSKSGRTPLLVAARYAGSVEVIRFLLEKGAVLAKARDAMGNTPLMHAALADDTAMVKFLLEKGEDANAKNAGGFAPLMWVSASGNAEAVKMLLAKGADAKAQSGPSFDRAVKNGPIAIGLLTPLILAASSGSEETVRLLLEAGADVNAKDVRGMTPLMLAVANDHPNEKIIRMILAKRPDMDAKSKAGETALAWAAKFRNPMVMAALKAPMPGDNITINRAAVKDSIGSEDVRAAVEKSVGLLQRTSTSFFKEGGCMSCHSHNITTMAVSAARAKGIRFDQAVSAETVRGIRLFFAAAVEPMLERLDPPAVDILNYALAALAFDGGPSDKVTDAMVLNVAGQQNPQGSWRFSGIQRPPMADGGISSTALAIRVLRQYAPPARKAEMDERIARGARWLLQAEPRTTEDAVMQLLGVAWADGDQNKLRALTQKLLTLQRRNGGWAQTAYLEPDAYATGTALYALNEAGRVLPSDSAYQKGVRFLLGTQAADGSWRVASRAPKFQPYFESGFPYGHDQWISQMATGWATMALSAAVPEGKLAAR